MEDRIICVNGTYKYLPVTFYVATEEWECYLLGIRGTWAEVKKGY